MNHKSIEERLTALEKEVAELKKQISTQPQEVEEVVESLVSGLKAAFIKMTRGCGQNAS